MFELHDVIAVEALEGNRIHLEFENGRRGIFDMSPLLSRGVFRELQRPEVFASVHVAGGTAAWPGGIDVAPERLYEGLIIDE